MEVVEELDYSALRMVENSKSSRRNQKISLSQIEAIEDVLDRLEKKPQPKLSRHEKLYQMKDKIERVLQLGYSYEEISLVLKQQGIDLNAEQLLRWHESRSPKDKSKGS